MMENILYLDDYINLYNKKKDLLIKNIPYKGTLKYGKIIDHIKFIKKYNKILENNKLNKNILGSSILVIINDSYTKEDKRIIKEALENLNYKRVVFKNELEYFKIKKNSILINANQDYINITYLENNGKVKVFNLEYNSFFKEILIDVLKKFKNKIIYYYFEESENLILSKIILDKHL